MLVRQVFLLFGSVCWAQLAIAAWSDWVSAGDAAAIRERWSEYASERGAYAMHRHELVLRGTIDDYLAAHPHVTVYARIPNGVVLKSPRSPEDTWVMVQVKSVQGNALILGPDRLPYPVRRPDHVEAWLFPPISIAFDEERHYAAYYLDRRNRIDTFAIWERRPGGEPVPVAVIYTPREVPRPVLLPDSENDKQRWIRALLMSFDFYRELEAVQRIRNWHGEDASLLEILGGVLAPAAMLILGSLFVYRRYRVGPGFFQDYSEDIEVAKSLGSGRCLRCATKLRRGYYWEGKYLGGTLERIWFCTKCKKYAAQMVEPSAGA